MIIMKKIFILIILFQYIIGRPAFSKNKDLIDKTNENQHIPSYAKIMNEVDSTVKNKDFQVFFYRFHKKPEKAVPYIKTQNIDLYFIDGYKYKKPANYARTSASQALIREINSAKKTIDFAVFGFSSQPEILKALLKAKKRGVQIRWVVDMTPWNFNFYGGTKYTLKILPNYKTDYETDKETLERYQQKGFKNYNGTLIHDKYFIFDKKVVWTGSTNISSSGTGGYNTNISAVIKSAKIAELYTLDFEKMFVQGLFHKNKPVLSQKGILLEDNSVVDVFFSPNSTILEDGILPIINSAKQYIYVPIFYLTNQKIYDALYESKTKGVDVRIILDAHSATTQHSKVEEIRKLGIPIKVENLGGKMHMKSLISDDTYIILGSCNFTNTGINKNDENLIIIKNTELAKGFKTKFLEYWKIIPDNWLYATPKPEGEDSIGSCSDGLDNDHNGLTDKEDPNCSN